MKSYRKENQKPKSQGKATSKQAKHAKKLLSALLIITKQPMRQSHYSFDKLECEIINFGIYPVYDFSVSLLVLEEGVEKSFYWESLRDIIIEILRFFLLRLVGEMELIDVDILPLFWCLFTLGLHCGGHIAFGIGGDFLF